jgi:hypothetical protein
MSPQLREFLRALGRIDWPRQLQRGAVLARVLRGDSQTDIDTDHVDTSERVRSLETAIENVARNVVGKQQQQQPEKN